MESQKVFRVQSESGLLQVFSVLKKLLDGQVWVLTAQPEIEKRRSQQNRRYWAVLHEIADTLDISNADAWHEFFKRRFIGVKEITLPDGEIIYVGRSSTDLSVQEFSDYMTSIEAWAVDNGVIFNELPE